jgi:hypothetical protein
MAIWRFGDLAIFGDFAAAVASAAPPRAKRKHEVPWIFWGVVFKIWLLAALKRGERVSQFWTQKVGAKRTCEFGQCCEKVYGSTEMA